MISINHLPQEKKVIYKSISTQRLLRSTSNKMKVVKNGYFDPLTQRENDTQTDTPLLKAFMSGNKSKFVELFDKYSAISQVNQLMFNVFMHGKDFHLEMRQADLMNNIDVSGKTILHYAAAGDLDMEEGYFKQLP